MTPVGEGNPSRGGSESAGSSSSTFQGPLPHIMRALSEENRELALELLKSMPSKDGNRAPSVPLSGGFRQRLFFADEGLRTLILRHVLPLEESRNPPSAKKSTKKKQNAPPRGEDGDLPLPKGCGIVGVPRVLFRTAGSKEDVGRGMGSADAGGNIHIRPDGSGGAEVSLMDSKLGGPFAFLSANDADLDDLDGDDIIDWMDGSEDAVTYFLRPTPMHARACGAAVRRLDRLHQRRRKKGEHALSGPLQHRIVFVPRRSTMCDRILLDDGILPLETVSVAELDVDLVALDSDVLSLELPDAIKTADVDGLPSEVVSATAAALLKIQDAAGVIPRIQGLGPLAEAVIGKAMSLRMDEYDPEEETDPSTDSPDGMGLTDPALRDIEAAIVIDRKVDMVTPMLTPLTYEGLLDEVFGISSGFIRVDSTVIDPPDQSETKEADAPPVKSAVALPLNDADRLYKEVRDQHVEQFGSFLQEQAIALKESHSNFTNKQRGRDLTEIHQFVKQIPVFTQNVRSLTSHIHLAEVVKQTTEESEFRQLWQTERSMVESEPQYDTLDDLIANQERPYRVLRLLCLQSLTGGGIKSAKFDSLRRDIVQTYGYDYLFVLQNLEKVGALRRRETLWMDLASPFSNLRKLLVLVNADVNTSDPDDVSYVSSGYAPLSVRLVQAATQGWSGKEEVLRELPGRLVDVVQQETPEDLPTAMRRTPGPNLTEAAQLRPEGKTNAEKPVLLLFFVGGLTFMEVAGLRFLARRPSFPYRIICCTTQIINGDTFLKSLSRP